ncbi:(2Fe-2S) ferredoxin domain-containing protein [Nocardiopsis sp. HUAS JQ3]|uniref:(2Fe-2S) ferredoxin domain-containing protein n=1 Tax=Nocardiopsis sp. HUAS JQ3 TaxID=3061629 RepID=UPI0023AA0DAF|nr:(2Fe-2S) ferredoxin domain-containing protein [Nocardiopsis sp. HUAS JQ3]WDZ89531.1 (2Fe-2S) ferredoxin domain-containing protein [Nocardiopsis sp. HUAS JQ3]
MDHKAQLARLRAIDDHSGRSVPVRTSKCLGICFQANVVVVQPSSAGRAAGGRPVWLGEVTEDKLVEAVDDWIFEGGPGIAPLPAVLADHVTSKDAKKPKKRKKPKHSKAAKKERRKDRREGAARPGKDGGKKKDEKSKKNKKDEKSEKNKKDKKSEKDEKKAGKAKDRKSKKGG